MFNQTEAIDMANDSNQRKSQPNFTLAFKQMASFVAIAKTRQISEVLDELIQQSFFVLPSEPLSTPDQVAHAMKSIFGIDINSKDVGMALERLRKAQIIVNIGNGHLALAPSVKEALRLRVGSAKALETDVRNVWQKQAGLIAPNLDPEKLWLTLRSYLAQAFRRHGIQAVELLNPDAALGKDSKVGLSSILDGIIAKQFPERERALARESVSAFFLNVSSDRKRAEYIANLADGAFNYFSLAVAPEVSEKLRGKLNNLTLFLDTNFLFGLLNLHVNPQVDVSSELIEAIGKFKLPFRLRYHEATVREMTNTLFYFGKELKLRKWPQKISRAVVASGALSGIEMRYHSKNAEQPVAVEDFLAPYQHWQELLKGRGIDVYNVIDSQEHFLARANLEADYKDYLTYVHREKPVDAVQHDMNVMETVQSLRTNAKSTLDAGALLITCDYHLFRFDYEKSRDDGRHHSTVLPSLFWQILRPFVADNEDFDNAFAETFALPEFSLGKGGAQRAAARMVSILASYSDIPEETATKMLANDLLIAELQSKKTDAEFAETIESVLASENAALLEETAALAAQLERERLEAGAKQRDLELSAEVIASREKALADSEQALNEKAAEIERLQVEKADQTKIATNAAQNVIREHQEAQAATALAEQLQNDLAGARRTADRTAKIASFLIGALVIGLFEIIIRSVSPWTWLLNHQNGFGIEGCIILIMFLGVLGIGVKQWRNTLFVVGCLGALLVLLQIVGGNKPPLP